MKPKKKPSPNKQQPGRGNRICPECHKATPARSAKCQQCGHVKQQEPKGAVPRLARAIDLIEQNGGISAVEEKVKSAEAAMRTIINPLGGLEQIKLYLETISGMGGPKKAKETLSKLGEIQKL